VDVQAGQGQPRAESHATDQADDERSEKASSARLTVRQGRDAARHAGGYASPRVRAMSRTAWCGHLWGMAGCLGYTVGKHT
jgi:hypothetical protein